MLKRWNFLKTGFYEGIRLLFAADQDSTRPKVRLSGHKGAIPNLLYSEVVSSPPNGSAYAAGDRIDMLFVFTQPLRHPEGLVVPFWLGNGAEHRREARLVTEALYDFEYLIFSYTVQSGDTDTSWDIHRGGPVGRQRWYRLPCIQHPRCSRSPAACGQPASGESICRRLQPRDVRGSSLQRCTFRIFRRRSRLRVFHLCTSK